ncbi:MAG: DEAD/DEAH box helicase family protein [Planctomycetota bacterium]
MAAARRSNRRRTAATRATHRVQGETLQQRLFLLRFLHAEFGFHRDVAEVDDPRGEAATRVLLSTLKESKEGYGTDGLSYVASTLTDLADKRVSDTDINRYDANIRSHLHRINVRRGEPLTLRYFQTLALLYAERVLDRLSRGPKQFCKELNDFVRRTRSAGWRDFPRFSEASLRKLAFMMATGSGKTLLLHINYLQFLHYNGSQPISNILLITPGPDLSEQHQRELRVSGLPCRLFDAGRQRDSADNPHTIEIIPISRFVSEKKDRGTRIEPAAFSGRNLVFVDEGHRSKSEEGVQRQIREALAGDEGFVFEYSATFQQAFAGDDDDQRARRDEYGAAVCFDYSYKWFLHDGFGKDFTVLNSAGVEAETGTWSLLAGVFVFAAQCHAYRNNRTALGNYNLAAPLALMVGREIASGNGKLTEDGKITRADVLSALNFFHRFLRNENGWTVQSLDALLGSTTPIDSSGHGLSLKEARDYWASAGITTGAGMFEWFAAHVLHSPGGGGLVVHRIKGNENEIALRGSEDQGQRPFGLVYIGKAPDLTNAIPTDTGIEQSEDHLADAWFPRIDDPGSPVNFLLGAKKFIEGWSSWRVSAMGLINIGKSEGSEIIQLFGRGVRLLGLHRLLKRSKHLTGYVHPVCLPLLERLFVFAIDAKYMQKFRETIDREGVDGGGFIEFELELWRTIDQPNPPTLHLPNWPGEERFKREQAIRLEASYLGNVPSRRTITVRRETRFEDLQSDETGTAAVQASTAAMTLADCPWFPFVNQNTLYVRLCRYAREQGCDNMGFSAADVRALLKAQAPEMMVQADAEYHRSDSWTARRRWEDAVFDLLKGAFDRIYRRAQQTWETHNMTLSALREDHPNYKFTYKVRVPQKLASVAPQFIRDLQALIAQCPKQNWTGREAVMAVANFGEHLYQPLVLDAEVNSATPNAAEKQQLTIAPLSLTASEQEFVEMLRDYWLANAETAHAGESIYLLRNLSRGKGVGFFESEGFYPDFILWHRKADGTQRLVFIEPHGMRQDDAPDINNKVQLAMEIGKHLNDLLQAPGCPVQEVTAYIVSATPFAELRRKHGVNWTVQRYADHHILFPTEMRRPSSRLAGLL